MIEVERIIIGSGPASNFYQSLNVNENSVIFDASFFTHGITEFSKLDKFALNGTLHTWGGNLFFENQRLAKLGTKWVNKIEELFPNCVVNERYESDLGFGFLLPKGFYSKTRQFVLRKKIKYIDKYGSDFIVQTDNEIFRCNVLVIATGKSTKYDFSHDASGLTLEPWDGVVFDKEMNIEFDNKDYGQISVNEYDGTVVSRYKLLNYGYSKISSADFIKLVHIMNRQAPFSSLINRSFSTLPLVLLQRLLKLESKQNLYLTTTSKPQIGKNIVQCDGILNMQHKFDKTRNLPGTTFQRALHTEIFQPSTVIKRFTEMGIIHDQFSTDDLSFAVGSVGNRLTRLIETSNV